MPVSYDRVAAALTWHDPRNMQWDARGADPLSARVERRLDQLRAHATLATGGRSAIEAYARLCELGGAVSPGSIPQAAIGHRLPLVLGQGPSLDGLVPVIRSQRDRFCLIVPYRTAVHLCRSDVWADIVVLADRGTTPYRISEALWSETPASSRRRLARTSTLLMDPFAPAPIYQAFDRVCLLDDGTGQHGNNLPLPFWGLALLTCLALPLALGARCAAIGGIDLHAAAGRPRRTWAGDTARLDPRFAPLATLLEVLALCDRTVVDVSASSIAKRGFTHEPLDALARRTPSFAPATAPAPATEDWARANARQVLVSLDHEARVVASIQGHAAHGLQLTEQPDGPEAHGELARVLDLIEGRWLTEPGYRDVIARMRPVYLTTLTRLNKMRVQAVNPREAVRRKTRLVCAELVDLAEEYQHHLESIRRTVSPPNAPEACR